MKAKIERGNAGSDPLFALRCTDAKHLKTRATFTRDDLAAPVKRHAGALQYRQIAQPIPGEIRRGAHEAQHIAPGAKPRRGGRFHHSGNTHAASQQFTRKLQIERPAARNHRALGGAYALRACKRLQRAGRHHTRQSPARHRHRAFMRAGGQDQPTRAESNGGTFHKCCDFIWREAAPNRGTVMEANPCFPRAGKKRATLAELRIRRGMAVTGGERLQILPAGCFAFIQHHHLGAGFGRGDGGGKPGGAGANHQDIADLFNNFGGRTAKRGRFGWEGAFYRHAIGNLHHAGALAGLAIHRDHAIKTGAHAAPKPALRALGGFAQRQNSGSRKRCGNALARQGFHRRAIEADPDRRRRRGDMGVM